MRPYLICLLGMLGTTAVELPASVAGDARDASSSITVAIAVPKFHGRRSIIHSGDASHFHVVVRNVSNKLQRVWSQSCSWGHNSLSFRLTDAAGKQVTIRRSAVPFLQNSPEFIELGPGESQVISVYFASDDWVGFPRPKVGTTQTVRMRCALNVRSDEFARETGVWTGSVSSADEEYDFETRDR